MSKWILVAAVLQGGVWVPGAEEGFVNRHFETITACTVMRDQQNRLGRNLYRRFECVAPGSCASPSHQRFVVFVLRRAALLFVKRRC